MTDQQNSPLGNAMKMKYPRWRKFMCFAAGLFICFAACVRGTTQEPSDSFTAKVVNLTLTEIAKTGPNLEIAAYFSRSVDIYWPRRYELKNVILPYLDAVEASKIEAALDMLYRLRGFRPLIGLGFNEADWAKEHQDFFSDLDKAVDARMSRLVLVKEEAVLRNLALYLGTSRLPSAKKALLQLAKTPAVTEQALICLGWHKDPNDMEELLPFLLTGGQETASLPSLFRSSYGVASLPYLRKAMSQAASPFTRLQAAFELIHLNDKTGIGYLLQAVRQRDTLPNGKAQAEEIRQFAIDYLSFPRSSTDFDALLRCLKSKSF